MRSQGTLPLSDGTSYELRSDLAQYCLPDASRDETRKLAWANSICLLFLVVSLVSLPEPEIAIRKPAPRLPGREIVIPLPESESLSAESETAVIPEVNQALPWERLEPIEPVVVARMEEVNFAVPVEGNVVVSTVPRFVPPPPAIIPKRPQPPAQPTFRAIRFGDRAFRKQPPPNYPPEFQRSRIGGVVEILFGVDTNGVPRNVQVGRSSGSSALDRHVCQFIQQEWRAYPGEAGHFRISITFEP